MNPRQVIDGALERRADVGQDDGWYVAILLEQLAEVLYIHTAVIVRSYDLATSAKRAEQPFERKRFP